MLAMRGYGERASWATRWELTWNRSGQFWDNRELRFRMARSVGEGRSQDRGGVYKRKGINIIASVIHNRCIVVSIKQNNDTTTQPEVCACVRERLCVCVCMCECV
jgi:hypothetical protein